MAAPEPSEVDAKVKQSLEGTPFEASALTRLSGGSVNWTYEATLVKPLDDGTKQVMIKHAEERMKARPDTILPLERGKREAECFKRLSHLTGDTGQGTSFSISVRTPKYHHYDEENANQLLELMPQGITLKDYVLKYYALPTPDTAEPEAREIGKNLGSWLRKFTEWSSSHAELQAMAEKNVEGHFFRHWVTFGWLKDRAEQYPAICDNAKEIFAKVEQSAAGERDDPSKAQVIHGDFWTGNILIPDAPMPQDGSKVEVFVIDWEMVHLNAPNVDFGEMIAELYTIWLFKSIPAGLWILEAMVEGYGEVTEASAFRTAIQVGAHLVSVIGENTNWGPQEQVEKAITVGKDMIVHAWNKDRTWFEKGELACIFRQVK